MAQAMKGVTRAMQKMNNQLKLPQIQVGDETAIVEICIFLYNVIGERELGFVFRSGLIFALRNCQQHLGYTVSGQNIKGIYIILLVLI